MEARLLSTAIIGKTHGVDGYLKLHSLSGEYRHLMKIRKCFCQSRDGKLTELEVDGTKVNGDSLLMRFSGYDTPEKARLLSGSVIKIDRSDAPKLRKGEYYVADLYGLDVISEGRKVGSVVETSDGAQSLLLHVECEGKIHLVPLLDVYVGKVDIVNGTLELLAPYLLE